MCNFLELNKLKYMTIVEFLQHFVYLCRKFTFMEEGKVKKERTVVHLYQKENDTHHYFGSVANVFEKFDKETVGITFGSLRNYGLSAEKPYENKKIIIRKGILQAKPKKNN